MKNSKYAMGFCKVNMTNPIWSTKYFVALDFIESVHMRDSSSKNYEYFTYSKFDMDTEWRTNIFT